METVLQHVVQYFRANAWIKVRRNEKLIIGIRTRRNETDQRLKIDDRNFNISYAKIQENLINS